MSIKANIYIATYQHWVLTKTSIVSVLQRCFGQDLRHCSPDTDEMPIIYAISLTIDPGGSVSDVSCNQIRESVIRETLRSFNLKLNNYED